MTEICRTCLQEITDSSVIFCLNPNDTSKSKSISIRCKLEYCIPELDLDIIPNAVICNNCFESLNLAHKFKNKCLETEGRIQSYIEKIGYVFAYIDLKQIAQQQSRNERTDCEKSLEDSCGGKDIQKSNNNEKRDNFDLTNLQCDTRNFFAVPKIAQLLAGVEERSSRPDSFKCVHCGYATSTKPDLENHEKVHLHKCNECDFTAPKRQSLIIHMRQHLKKKYSCTHCSYKTPYMTMLTEHNKVHINVKTTTSNKQLLSTDKYFKCKICNYKARLKLDLKSHVKNHHGSYKCIICGYLSPHKENFICHLRSHTHKNWNKSPQQVQTVVSGYTLLYCYKCGYKTAWKLDLEKHLRLHTKSETMLNLHIKSNGNDYLKQALACSAPTDLKLNIETSNASLPLKSCIKN